MFPFHLWDRLWSFLWSNCRLANNTLRNLMACRLCSFLCTCLHWRSVQYLLRVSDILWTILSKYRRWPKYAHRNLLACRISIIPYMHLLFGRATCPSHASIHLTILHHSISHLAKCSNQHHAACHSNTLPYNCIDWGTFQPRNLSSDHCPIHPHKSSYSYTP